jgi:hypothetical protein
MLAISAGRNPASTVRKILCNVLCVIKESKLDVLRRVKALVKSGGEVYISCYRGRGNQAGPTCNGWQNNRPLKSYLIEVEAVFPGAKLVGQMIVATT